MLTVTKIFEFEAAHCLPEYNGKCKNLHGHSYKLEVEVSGYVDEKHNKDKYPTMVVDFGKIKHIVSFKILDYYDHADLNKHFNFPTAEAMVQEMVVTLQEYFIVERVRLWETSTSY